MLWFRRKSDQWLPKEEAGATRKITFFGDLERKEEVVKEKWVIEDEKGYCGKEVKGTGRN